MFVDPKLQRRLLRTNGRRMNQSVYGIENNACLRGCNDESACSLHLKV